MSGVIGELLKRGAIIPDPGSVFIASDVDLSRVEAEGLEIHSGVRISGKSTAIGRGSKIGTEGPIVLRNTVIGRNVVLGSGTIDGSVLLDGVTVGPSCHIRPGTLMEEDASIAHAVGLKQTILLSFSVLGSLINFCDCLLYGGRHRKDHSEVGSGFIHFNFTPFGKGGDKATASLFGDVPRGVFMREDRIFLGGQGGAVGPIAIGFGTVIAAGAVYRRDRGDHVIALGEPLPGTEVPFDGRRLRGVRRKVASNLRYLGNLAALWRWYLEVRRRSAHGDVFVSEAYASAADLIRGNVEERLKRLDELHGYVTDSLPTFEDSPDFADERASQREFLAEWPDVRGRLASWTDMASAPPLPEALDRALAASESLNHVALVRGLPDQAVDAGRRWLEGIVAATTATWSR